MPNISLILAGSYAASDQPGIYAFEFDEDSGTLTPRGQFAGIKNPSFIAAHPNGRWLYAVSETGQGSDGVAGGVCALSFERQPWRIQLLNTQPSGGDWPCHLAIDATGRWLFASNYGSGNASAFPILEDGALGAMTALVSHSGQGPNAQRQEGPHAHSATLTPDNAFVIVADLGIDALMMYRFNVQDGSLKLHREIRTRPGAGPRHMAFHPSLSLAYVVNELDSTVTAYTYSAAEGALTEKQTLEGLPPNAPENTAADIHLNRAGTRLYTSNRGHNSIAVFEVAADGMLARLATPSCGGNWPRNFALSRAEKFMLVANQYSGQISVLPLTDELGEAVTQAAVPGASCLQVL
ncbi:MAG: lactonase family protein [Anaerolineales bacterium]|nr:lactonase family protein [Anaerolineales bacterium]